MLTQMLVCHSESSEKNVGDGHHSASAKSYMRPLYIISCKGG